MCEGECDHQTAKGAKSTKGETAAADEKREREEEKKRREEGENRERMTQVKKRGRNEREKMCGRRRRSRQKGRVGEKRGSAALAVLSAASLLLSRRLRQLHGLAGGLGSCTAWRNTVAKQQGTAVSTVVASATGAVATLLSAHGSLAQSNPRAAIRVLCCRPASTGELISV